MSKYTATQHSIQTYYNVNGSTSTAMGVEHTNENFGMDLRWTWGHNSQSTTYWNNIDNGRYTVWNFLTRSTPTSYQIQTQNTSPSWSNFVGFGNLEKINAYSGQGLNVNESYRYLPMIELISSDISDEFVDISMGDTYGSGSNNSQFAIANQYDPQSNSATAQYLEVLNACMNRNRDEDGDGVIDKEELKWYVPSMAQYVRVIVGRNALPSPIMDYPNTLPSVAHKHLWTRYRYASANASILWADEGISTSNLGQYSAMPWQVRCIRNLGTNLAKDITSTSGVTDAFTSTSETSTTSTYRGGGIVKIGNYNSLCLRINTTNPLLPHYANNNENRLGIYGFEWAQNSYVATVSNSTLDAYLNGINNNNTYTLSVNNQNYNLCSGLETLTGRSGWRVPNQKELTLIYLSNISITPYSDDSYFMSCTYSPYNSDGELNASDINNFAMMRIERNSTNAGMTSQGYRDANRLRCVRDLTAAEKDKTYEQIRSNQ